MNQLNERLRVVRTQKALLQKKVEKEELSQEEMTELCSQIQELREEELDLLRKLNV